MASGVYGQTVISFVSLMLVFVCGIYLFRAPRKYAVLPLFIVTLYITHTQRIVIAGIDFSMLRIIVMVGWLRIIKNNEFKLIKWNSIDSLLLYWSLLGVITYTILWKTSGAFINRLGFVYDSVGLYLIFRVFVRSFEDLSVTIKILLLLSTPIAFAMMIEKTIGYNLFSFFGGVPEITLLREGKLRAQGAFSHPILAGSFGAFLVPLTIGLWKAKKEKFYLVLGLFSATLITLGSASSGPMIAYASGIMAIFLIKCRKHMRIIFWGTIGLFVSLHIMMKSPVWHLIGRISVVSGSTGYHRYRLIDAAINNFWEWWLIGTKSTAHWGWQMEDVTNMYIFVAVTQGGFLGLILFIALLIRCFKAVGRGVRRFELHPEKRWFAWSIGCALFTHAVSFISVAYFGQMIMCLYFCLALSTTFGSISCLNDIDGGEKK